MIALIGEKEIWRGFVPLGVKIFEAENREEVIAAFDKVEKENFLFVLLSDEAALKIENQLSEFYKRKNINIVLLNAIDVKSKKQNEQLYYKRLKAVTEKAMGIDVLSDK